MLFLPHPAATNVGVTMSIYAVVSRGFSDRLGVMYPARGFFCGECHDDALDAIPQGSDAFIPAFPRVAFRLVPLALVKCDYCGEVRI